MIPESQQTKSPEEDQQSPQDFNLSLAEQHYELCERQPHTTTALTAWSRQSEVIRYEAQKVINQLGPDAKNAFKLFKSQGIAVTWPGFWERYQIRRVQARLQRQAALEYELQSVMVNDYETMKRALADYNAPKKNSLLTSEGRIFANGWIMVHNQNVTMHPEIAKRLGYKRQELI